MKQQGIAAAAHLAPLAFYLPAAGS